MRIPGTWKDYCQLRDSRGDGSIPRLKYHAGEILLMSPLPRHGREAHLIARIVEIILESQDRNYEAFTPITLELPEVGGIEMRSLEITAYTIVTPKHRTVQLYHFRLWLLRFAFLVAIE